MFRWFESLIDIFPPLENIIPPRKIPHFYLYYIKSIWRLLLAALIVGFFSALTEVAMFEFLGRIIDVIIKSSKDKILVEYGNQLTMMALIILLARPLLVALHNFLINQAITPGLSSRTRWLMHNYVAQQNLEFFQSDFAGRIANRVMQTGTSLRASVIHMVDASWFIIVYTGSAFYLFNLASPWLIAPLFAWCLIYLSMLIYFLPKMRNSSWASADARSRVMGLIVDGYTNIATLKLFTHAEREQGYVREAILDHTIKHRAQTRVTTVVDIATTTLNGLLIAGTCALALFLWSQSKVSIGEIAIASSLVIRINSMSNWIMWTINGIYEDVGIVQDSIQTISNPVFGQDIVDANELQVTRGEVRFENLHFQYVKRTKVITDFNLKIHPGEKIGLVGPSGAGKSTLVKVMLRLYELPSGRIFIDGQDIALATQESIRRQIGVVTQDTSLLHRSIRDNLLYGRPDASDMQLRQAIRRAHASDFIDSLVDEQGRRGLDAYVGERGVKLSGGQRQRIAIARVLLKDAPILVLDEATSALDSEIEAAIQDSLDQLIGGKTVIAIAHRLSTIARMDRLVVMEQGAIIEEGSHAELIARGGRYARLWVRQAVLTKT